MSEKLESTSDNDANLVPTLYNRCSIAIRGWESDEGAHDLGQYVLSLARSVSRYFDLSRLESIVIGQDYSEALSSVKRNDSAEEIVPTSNEYGQGGAMAVTVNRDDELWSVVVVAAPIAILLIQPTHELHRLALNIFIHELVHVNELRLFESTFPGGWRAVTSPDRRHAMLFGMAKVCQSEYVAARASSWAYPEFGLSLLEMAAEALRDLDELIRSARYAYRRNSDIGNFWRIVSEHVEFVFKALGYALGHYDAIDVDDVIDASLRAKHDEKLSVLKSLPSGWVVDETRAAAKKFHRLEAFTGLDLYDELIGVAERVLHQFGIFPQANGYLDVPHRSPWLDL